MSKKGERNQSLQPSKAEKAYGGYLPSVEAPGDPKEREAKSPTERSLHISQPEA